MALRVADFKNNTFVIVKKSNSEEIQQVVHLHDTKIGTSTISKNLVVTGNSIVQGRLMGGSAGVPSLAGGRLTLTSDTAITTSDVTNASTIYYTPFETAQITLWTGSEWALFWFDELSLVLSSLSASKNYDVFAYAVGEQIQLELGTAWSGDNTRSDNLVYFQGVLCLEKNPTRRYVGTIRTTSSSLLEDSISKRFVWNFYNRVEQYLYVEDTTASWTYSSATWRQVRGQSTNKVEAVFGTASTVSGSSFIMWNGAGGTGVSLYTSVGIDSTTTPSATIATMLMPTLVAQYWWPSSSMLDTAVTAGYHAFNWIEYAHATGLTGMGTVGFSQSHMRIRYMM